MSNLYVGIRASHKDVDTVFKGVGRLNQGLAAFLRKAANKHGIKQSTKEGGKLEFYCLDQKNYDAVVNDKQAFLRTLKGMPNLCPLASIPEDTLVDSVKQFCAKHKQPFSDKVEASLVKLLAKDLTVLKEDVKTTRARIPTCEEIGVMVGDRLCGNGFSKVVAVKEKSYVVETLIPSYELQRQIQKAFQDRRASNAPLAKAKAGGLEKVTGWSSGDGWDYSYEIPYTPYNMKLLKKIGTVRRETRRLDSRDTAKKYAKFNSNLGQATFTDYSYTR